MTTNITTLDRLGYREIGMLADLLKAYADNPNDCGLGDGVNWEYNPNYDNILLIDEDYNVAMMNDENKLAKWYACGECGHEGFHDTFTNLPEHPTLDGVVSPETDELCPECSQIAEL